MKTWGVTVPIVGFAYVEVEAETADGAIDEALLMVGTDDIEQWEAAKWADMDTARKRLVWAAKGRIVSGNIFHGSRNEATAEDLDD